MIQKREQGRELGGFETATGLGFETGAWDSKLRFSWDSKLRKLGFETGKLAGIRNWAIHWDSKLVSTDWDSKLDP